MAGSDVLCFSKFPTSDSVFANTSVIKSRDEATSTAFKSSILFRFANARAEQGGTKMGVFDVFSSQITCVGAFCPIFVQLCAREPDLNKPEQTPGFFDLSIRISKISTGKSFPARGNYLINANLRAIANGAICAICEE